MKTNPTDLATAAQEFFRRRRPLCSRPAIPAFLACGINPRHEKSILISPPDVDIEHLLPPYTAEKVQALKSVVRLLAGRTKPVREGKVHCDDKQS